MDHAGLSAMYLYAFGLAAVFVILALGDLLPTLMGLVWVVVKAIVPTLLLGAATIIPLALAFKHWVL